MLTICLETFNIAGEQSNEIAACLGSLILLNIIIANLLWLFVHQKFWNHC